MRSLFSSFLRLRLTVFGSLVIGSFCLYLAKSKLLTLALLMLKIDLFAGGGFASLPLMLQQVCARRAHGVLPFGSFLLQDGRQKSLGQDVKRLRNGSDARLNLDAMFLQELP